jgi:hypothetical protein
MSVGLVLVAKAVAKKIQDIVCMSVIFNYA